MNIRIRYPLIAAAVLLIPWSAGTLWSAASAECKDCNVILISLDTLRADALGAYGSDFGSSPSIDRAAKKGFVFLNAFSPVPSTIPSHMSVFSGLYPSRHGVLHAWMPGKMRSPHPTLAEILSDLGYRTAWVWVAPFPSEDPMVEIRHVGFGRGFETFINEAVSQGTGTLTAFSWLEKNASEPFFLFLHNYRMHDPYAPSRRSMRLFFNKLHRKKYMTSEDLNQKLSEAIERDPSLVFSTRTASGVMMRYHRLYALRDREMFWRQFNLRDPMQQEDLKTLYAANLRDVDEWFAGLIRKLEDLKILDKTILVLMSDHGEEFWEHGRFSHSQLYVETLHVPLIFIFPKGRGRSIPDVVSGVDIYPTILEILGIGIPETVQGMSLKTLMEGGAYPEERFVFGDHGARSSYSVRDAARAYIVDRSEGFVERYYDRVNDPGETRDLIEANEAVSIKKYRRILKSFLEGR